MNELVNGLSIIPLTQPLSLFPIPEHPFPFYLPDNRPWCRTCKHFPSDPKIVRCIHEYQLCSIKCRVDLG